MSFTECVQVIEQFAALARLRRESSLAKGEGLPPLSQEAALWRAPWAQLLVLAVPNSSAESLADSAALGQEWLDVSCSIQERDNRGVVDGYLGLLLPERLPPDAEALCRQLELNTQTCRKHIFWPEDSPDSQLRWRRLFRITALGLPQSPVSEGMTQSPKLVSAFQIAILEDIKRFKGKAAARQHAEDASRAPLDDSN